MANKVTLRSGERLTLPSPSLDENSQQYQLLQNAIPSMTDTGEIDLRGILRAIYRRKFLLLASMIIVMAATLLWVSRITPRYSANVLIVIDHQGSGIVTVDRSAQGASTDPSQIKTETAILQSRNLAARLIEDFSLNEDPEFAPAEERPGLLATIWSSLGNALSAIRPVEVDAAEDELSARLDDNVSMPRADAVEGLAAIGDMAKAGEVQSWERLLMIKAQLEEAKVQQAVAHAALIDRFLSHLTVTSEEGSRLVEITFQSTEPAKAARIANKLVGEYIGGQLETKSEGARRTAEWLESRLSEMGEEQLKLERRIQQQRVESGSTALDMVAKTMAQLNTELVSAQAVVTARKARYEQVEDVLNGSGNLESLPSVIASGAVQALRSRHAALDNKLSDLLTVYGDNHPSILALRAEMRDVERRRDLEIQNILDGMLNEVRSAELEELKLRERLDAVSAEMVRLNTAEASIEQVKERLNANQGLYKNLLRQHTEAVALRDNQLPDARIISPAEIPLRPSYPNFTRVMLLAFVGSASLSAFLLIMVERFREKLDTAEDVERLIGVPVIGAVPDLPRLWRMKSAPSDYMQREPMSEFGSVFQRMRALMVLGNNRKMPRRVLITSSTAGEGKTTTAVCFAVACVTAGQRVLLIDCDFGRPRLHETVNVKNGMGLTDVMKGFASLDEAIAHSADYSLSILTIGCARDGAIDLLNYGRMEELLADIKDDYDTIVLDSAPVLEVSNALILGGLVEKTIMVIRREWTSRQKASEAIRQLQLYGADIAGIVFNRSNSVRDS